MPPLKLQTRAFVTPDFQQTLRQMFRAKAEDLLAKRKSTSTRVLDFWDRNNGVPLARLIQLVKQQDAFDHELTRLRGLPFTSYEVYNEYLLAKTEPITLLDMSSKETWDIGPYHVYIPTKVATEGLHSDVHFVPERAPMVEPRHPHHVCYYYNVIDPIHPTQGSSSTCWGSYGSIATSAIQAGDYVDLLRSIHSYLTRYNPGSPLTHSFFGKSWIIFKGGASATTIRRQHSPRRR